MYRYIFIKFNKIEIDTEGMEDRALHHVVLIRDENYIDINSQAHDYFKSLCPIDELNKHEPCDYYCWFMDTVIVDVHYIQGITEEEYEFLSQLQIVGSPVTQPLGGV